jgi:hypothetical protein
MSYGKLIIAAITCALLATSAADPVRPPGAPDIAFSEGTPADLLRLASATWTDFLAAFPGRRHCLDPVTVAPAAELGDRAAYTPEGALVTVRVPGTAANLRASLVHEFAHHLDYTCPRVRRLRRLFLAGQGLDTTRPWFTGSTWEQTPSEQFADAAVEIVLGRTSRLRLHAREIALEEMRAWGAGR